LNSNDFSVDLDHLDEVTIRIQAFSEYLADQLAGLDTRAQQLSSSWSGVSADAYDQAHREWIAAALEVRDGLKSIETATRAAHRNYGNASATNTRMFDV
jgi:WXG100 family type VII secretion target